MKYLLSRRYSQGRSDPHLVLGRGRPPTPPPAYNAETLVVRVPRPVRVFIGVFFGRYVVAVYTLESHLERLINDVTIAPSLAVRSCDAPPPVFSALTSRISAQIDVDAPTPSPVEAPTPDVGCYADQRNDRIFGDKNVDTSLTPEVCVERPR